MRSGLVRSVIWLLAVATCIAGLYLSFELTLKHLGKDDYEPSDLTAQDQAESTWLDTVCEATEHSDCDEVAKSGYAVFPFGSTPEQPHVPVSLLGMFYFTFVLAWLGLVGSCSPTRWWVHLIFVTITAVGVGISIFFEYIMWTQLDHWCPLCLVVHILSLVLMVFALLLWPRQEVDARGRASAEPPGILWPPLKIVAAVPVITLIAMWGEFVWLSPSGASPGYQRSTASRPADDGAAFASLTTRPAAELAKEVIETRRRLNNAEDSRDHWKKQADYFQRRLQQDVAAQSKDQTKTIEALSTQPADVLAKQVADLQTKLSGAQRGETSYKRQTEYYERHWEHAAVAWNLTPAVPINLENRPMRGPAHAAHTMVIFSDFQCPACKRFEQFVNERLLPLSEKNGGLVKLTFRHWPICQDCNPNATTNLHPLACKASYAAEAARMVGGDEAFWKMYDLLWDKQDEWKKSQDFVGLARAIGLNEQAFQQAMASDEVAAQIKADIEEGANLGKNQPNVKPEDVDFIKVNSTPSIFIDNKRLLRPLSLDRLWLTILSSRPRTAPTTAPRPVGQPIPAGPLAQPVPSATRPVQ